MKLSVVIATWRRPAELVRCLEALDAQAEPPGEVVVVVREDDAATRTRLSEDGGYGIPVHQVTVRVPGVVAALETGLRAARGEGVAFTDDDAVPHPDWIARIGRHLRANPRLGGVGGRDRFDAKDPPAWVKVVGRIRWYGRPVGDHHRGAGDPRSVDVLKGVNMAFRRVAIEDIGFDRRLRASGSQPHWEFGLCLAVKRAGWEVLYDPAIVVDHYEARRFGPAQRGFPNVEELRGAVHNEMYGMVRWLPWWRKPVVLGYGLVVGTREAPGLVTAVERAVRTRQVRSVARRLWAATRGRLDAVGTYATALREGR